jgi:hypothetical protein
MHQLTLPWTRFVTVAIGAIALASVAAPAAGTGAQTQDGACPDDAVTVVVDFTDLGGAIEIGCATDASTGTAALTSAGFVDTRDDSGMICAIDSLPDPCPAEFAGSWWSYWYADEDAWQSWQEGSDTAVPVAGGIEGWRYHDGSAGPGIEPAQVSEQGAPAGTDGAATPPADLAPEVSPWVFALVALAIVGAGAALAVRYLRRGSTSHGPYGQD